LADFDRVLALDPKSSILAIRGLTHQALGHYEEAFADFDRSLEDDPDEIWVLASRGQLHRELHHYDEALGDFSRALELDPDGLWFIAVDRARIHRALRHYDEALADFNRVIASKPESGWYRHECGIVLSLLGEEEKARERWQEAVSLLRLEIESKGAEARQPRGNLLVVFCAQGDWEQAEEQLRVFLAASPSVYQIRETLTDLADLRDTLPVDASRIAAVQRQLEQARGLLGGGSGTVG
jgi:tetratricopeptide (TPR) repeat protein